MILNELTRHAPLLNSSSENCGSHVIFSIFMLNLAQQCFRGFARYIKRGNGFEGSVFVCEHLLSWCILNEEPTNLVTE